MAKVTKDGRVLYYVGGKPVYAEDRKTSDPDTPSSAQKKKTGGRTYGDDTPDPPGKPKPDKDKDKDKTKGKYAKQVLVRGKDGRLHLQYVDVKTGKPIPPGVLKKYTTTTANAGLDQIYDQSGTKSTGDGHKKTTEAPTEPDKPMEPRNKLRDMPGSFSTTGATGSKASNSPTSGSPGGVSTNNTNSEQGDTDGFAQYDPGRTKSYRNGVTTNDVAPDDSSTPDKENAQSNSLTDYSATTGNNYHALEGQDLSKQTSVSATRNWTAEQKQDIAKTLAGEMDTRYTDINSPEAQQEANGIVSTIENRALKAYEGDPSKAIHAPNQYSTWNNEQLASNAEKNYAANKAKYDAMVDAYAEDPNSNLGYTHYVNPGIVNPGWAENMTVGAKIGPHQFYSSPEYTPDQHPLNDEQQKALASNIINQNVLQSPMTPIGSEIASTPPTIDTTGFVGSTLAAGMQAQRDDVSGIGSNPGWGADPNAGMAAGMAASRFGDQNRWGPTPSTVQGPSGLATGYAAQNDYGGYNANDAAAAGDRMGPTGGNLAEGMAAQRDYNSGASATPDAGRFSSTTEQGGNLAAGMAAQRDYGPGTVSNNFDKTRFGENVKTDQAAETAAGPSYNAQTGFATGYQPSISPSPAGVYGSPTGGFTQDDTADVGTGAAPSSTGNDTTGSTPGNAASSASSTGDTGSMGDGMSTTSGTSTASTSVGIGGTSTSTNTGESTSSGTTSSTSSSTSSSSDTDTDGGGFGGGGFGSDDGY